MVLVPSKRWRPARTASALATAITLGLLALGCSAGPAPDPSANPPASITPSPNYPDLCAPVGADSSSTCLRLTLEAVDRARSAEGLGPMRLPADFPLLIGARAALRRRRPRARRPRLGAVRRSVGGTRPGSAACGRSRPAPGSPGSRGPGGRGRVDRGCRQRPRRRVRVDVRRRPGERDTELLDTRRGPAAGPTGAPSSNISARVIS